MQSSQVLVYDFRDGFGYIWRVVRFNVYVGQGVVRFFVGFVFFSLKVEVDVKKINLFLSSFYGSGPGILRWAARPSSLYRPMFRSGYFSDIHT